MMDVMIRMNSDPINYGRNPIFVITSLKVKIETLLMPPRQIVTPLLPENPIGSFGMQI